MVVNMNNEEQVGTLVPVETLESKLQEIVNAVAMVNWTMQLVQNEFENIVATHTEVTREEIIEIMKGLEKDMNEKLQAQMMAQAATDEAVVPEDRALPAIEDKWVENATGDVILSDEEFQKLEDKINE